jgi:hypothetical protein
MSNKYKELANALKSLESFIFVHASANHVPTVESFLTIAVRKAVLEGEITLLANWTIKSIAAKKITIIISAQNEIPNVAHVEEFYKIVTKLKFKYFNFLKYVEYLPAPDDKTDSLETLSTTITSAGPTGNASCLCKVKDLRFHVAKFGADQYNRTLKIAVYVDEIIDKLIQPTASEDTWIPDKNLFYLMDLIFGEYYMTKHISNINFFPINVLASAPSQNRPVSIIEAKSNIDELLNLDHKICHKCKAPEYRVDIGNAGFCQNCQD